MCSTTDHPPYPDLGRDLPRQVASMTARGDEGVSLWIATDTESVARIVAPRLARALYPWIDTSDLDVLHVRAMAHDDGREGTEVVLRIGRRAPR